MGNDRPSVSASGFWKNFNPRSLVGNDSDTERCGISELFISIHVPSWGTTFFYYAVYNLIYFNPRSLVGNDVVLLARRIFYQNFNPRSLVGNDCVDISESLFPTISIHVPSWGTTVDILWIFHGIRYFNPRSLVGNDNSAQINANQHGISIHVPSWGTTAINADTVANMQFQSTFPRGERRLPLIITSQFKDYFNPRSLVGNDVT